VTLVGFSMGGGEVARYVGRFGTERVSKVVFLAAVTPCVYKSADNPEGALDDAAIATRQSGVRADRLGVLETFAKGFFSAGGEQRVTEAQTQLHLPARRRWHRPKRPTTASRLLGGPTFAPTSRRSTSRPW
jgi:non-heme chloroperoxidase